MPDFLILSAAIAVGVSCALVIGLPAGYYIFDRVYWYTGSRREKEISRKAKHKALSMRRKKERATCRRCGHERDRHAPEPIGCQVETMRDGSDITCECESYLAPQE